ncbi:MAG TPA: hypothetical protein VES67_08750 [Vicinamibacterales bacterium]|nr:hypothetical protein [Vicinamibacterales bacterium]
MLKQVSRREGGLLAGVSVGLGVAQLVFLRWAEERLDDATATAIAGVAFLAYLALVAGLLWRYQRKLNAVRPRCPNCGSRLEGLSARVAAATGRCDSCGGQVLE